MSLFINYDFNVGLSVSPERNPTGYANSDVQGLVEDMMSDCLHSSCPFDSALEALEDGALWSEEEREVVESIRVIVLNHEDGDQQV